jgi:hypothetical protein
LSETRRAFVESFVFILSASRRCDLPAFQLEAFLRRLRRGWVGVPNPFGGPPSRVPLRGPEVAGAVLWTRLPGRLRPHLTELLEAWDGHLRVQVSLTALPASFEAPRPAVDAVLRQVEALARILGPERLVWRFDPIILSSTTAPRERVAAFERLAASLNGLVAEVVVSWLDLYAKTRRACAGLNLASPDGDERRALLDRLVAVATRHNLPIKACCEPEMLAHPAIGQARCLDGEWFEQRRGLLPGALGSGPTRPGCGCAASRDIGVYGSCGFGCRYCYASRGPRERFARDPWAGTEAGMERLWPAPRDENPMLVRDTPGWRNWQTQRT